MIVARISAKDERRPTWERLFGTTSVPVTTAEPMDTVLPDGTLCQCFFVDFGIGGDPLFSRLIAHARTQKPERSAQLIGMLQQGVYPVRAENVTTIEAPVAYWRRIGWLPPE